MTIVSGAVNHYISSKSLVNGKLLLWYLRFTQVETGYLTTLQTCVEQSEKW